MKQLFKLQQQPSGQWTAIMLDGGYIETVTDCSSEEDARNSALYALAKNREYKEEASTDA